VQIHVFDTAEDLARAVATRIADQLRTNPRSVLGLATGGTPLATYAELRRMHAAGRVDFSQATTFNLDEFAGIDASHPGSFRRYMNVKLFDSVNLDPQRIHFLDGAAVDLDAECIRYEKAIDASGGIDLQLLGIGANGHIGFNEPDETLAARTHRVRLHDQTRRDTAALFGGDPTQVPREALSMGMATILKSRSIVMMAIGARKARCIEMAVNGSITTRLPASFLQLHRDAELYLDRGAAERLPRS
jgi:glucosamine-6-phosphate deaminase